MPALCIENWLQFVRRAPHEFSIQYPPRPEYFIENFSADPRGPFEVTENDPALLYIHIPFRTTRCAYCIFVTDQRTHPQIMDEYVVAVLTEIGTHPELNTDAIQCIDIGGGTPTALPPHSLEKLLARLSRIGTSESLGARSIETTPRALCENPEKVHIIRENGFHRISMGVQTSGTVALRLAQRRQEWRDVLQSFNIMRDAGIARINIDLIFGLPGQSPSGWMDDVARVAGLHPDSITTYDCLYRGSGRRLVSDTCTPPGLNVMEAMYNNAHEYLTAHGYHADYGSVNYSRHSGETGTSAYFERRLLWGDPYVGIGSNASSLLDSHWMFNHKDVDRYVAGVRAGQPIEYRYILPPTERMAKYALFSLNYGKLQSERFQQLFGVSLDSAYASELSYAEERGWIVRREDDVFIADGRFAAIYLLRSLLYSPAAKQWFMDWCEPLR